ncbi:MAG TPA: S-formylglutathione hydrolase [Steroidobacteraceae bacterium]|nr:S-formylglutathione hydrolase [Steroidobacteraceae bacterium]
MSEAPETLSRHQCFGGVVGFHRHDAAETSSPMRFSVYLPPQAERRKVPALWYLAGLTCTEETFMIKAGAQRAASELGIALIAPDTSPRGVPLPGDSDSWDFGVGAGFYVDATQAPWSRHYRMYSWITRELPMLVAQHFPVDAERQGIFGHSMGGHGALTIGLRNPDRYRSISAFAPISSPMNCPWGQKAFAGYLGPDRDNWRAYDASELLRALPAVTGRPPLLVDQGMADAFLEQQLMPDRLEQACKESGYPLTLRRHAGYDHGYYFISTFVEDHLRHHARTLLA